VERPNGAFGPWGLSNFGSMLLYNTNTSNGNADTSQHYGLWMVNNGTCASPGPWVGEQFTVTWKSYCS
jgi:hypothetical protein